MQAAAEAQPSTWAEAEAEALEEVPAVLPEGLAVAATEEVEEPPAEAPDVDVLAGALA